MHRRFARVVTIALFASCLAMFHCSGGDGAAGPGGGNPGGAEGGAADDAAGDSAAADGADGAVTPSGDDSGCAPSCAPPSVWTKAAAPLPVAPSAIHGSSASDVWVLGSQSVSTDAGSTEAVLTARFDGAAWKSIPTPPTMHDPRAIFAAGAAGTFVACAYTATVFQWNGTAWTDVFEASVSDPYALGGSSGKDIWLGTQWNFCDGPLYHFDGSYWSGVPYQNGQDGVSAFLAMGNDDVLAAFGSGIYRGSSTGNFRLVAGAQGVSGFAGAAPDDVWAFGTIFSAASITPFALHFDGKTWAMTKGPGGEDLTAGSCVAKGDCWIIGGDALFHTENGALVSQKGQPGAPDKVTNVWAAARDDVFALDGADVYHFAPPAQ